MSFGSSSSPKTVQRIPAIGKIVLDREDGGALKLPSISNYLMMLSVCCEVNVNPANVISRCIADRK